MQNYTLNKKQKIAVISFFIIIIIIPITLFIINIFKSSTLTIKIAPADTTIVINNKRYKNGKHKLFPGTYTISVSKEGFESYSTTINLTKNDSQNIYLCLEEKPDNNWYSFHSDDSNLCNAIEEERLSDENEKLFNSDKIFNFTPYHDYNNGFNIDPFFDENNKISILITSITCQKSKESIIQKNALEWLKSKDINPDDYTIVYQTSCD